MQSLKIQKCKAKMASSSKNIFKNWNLNFQIIKDQIQGEKIRILPINDDFPDYHQSKIKINSLKIEIF